MTFVHMSSQVFFPAEFLVTDITRVTWFRMHLNMMHPLIMSIERSGTMRTLVDVIVHFMFSLNMSQHMIFPSILFMTVGTLVFVSVILLLFHFDTCKSNMINFPFLG